VSEDSGAGWALGIGMLVGVGVLIFRARGASASGSPREWAPSPTGPVPHSIQEWIPLFRELGPDVPIPAAVAWLEGESGGNVCSVGNVPPPGVKYPAEYGLTQLDVNNPENVGFLSQADARAACQNSGSTRADWQRQLRPLSDAERRMHVKAAVDHMRSAHAHALDRIGPWGWDPNGIDAWTMAKLWHAGPAYVNLAGPTAAAMGRPPKNFAEFREKANAVGLQHGYTQYNLTVAWNNVAGFARRMTS